MVLSLRFSGFYQSAGKSKEERCKKYQKLLTTHAAMLRIALFKWQEKENNP